MDESTVAQIFEPFFTTREQGVGLGLASVYGIVHQSSGDVAVESSPGPDGVPDHAAARFERPGAVVAAPEPATDPARRRSCSSRTRTSSATDPPRARAAGLHRARVPDGPPRSRSPRPRIAAIDLLLTDVVMPGMRGYEVAKRVARSRPKIRILFMSGYAEETLVGGPRSRSTR